MKSLLVKLGVILVAIGLIVLSNIEVRGADWRVWSVDDENIFLYDVESISRISKNIIRVWVKLQYTDRGVIEAVKELGERYKNLSHKIALEEINCQEKKSRNLSLNYYSEEGRVLYYSSVEREWSYIVPGSVWDSLYKAVCK